MGTQRRSLSTLKLTLIVVYLSALPSSGWAQVATSITSSGLNTSVGAPAALPNGQIIHDITGGMRPGNGTNLFHSFGEFSVGSGHTANFLNNTGLSTTNILSRVTGGNPSNIFGTLQTTGFGNANLFLVNPAGVVFGPTASLNVGGMVSVSTADYIKLADGARFSAIPGAADALLSSAPVAAFGFLGNSPAAIAVQGSTLTVTEGQSLTFVGGNGGFTDMATGAVITPGITMSDATLSAPAGAINIISVGKPKNTKLGAEISLNSSQVPSGFKELGDIKLQTTGNVQAIMQVDASGQSGGTITIRGGQLELVNARVVADTNGAGSGAGILIAGKDVSISGHGGEAARIGSALGRGATGTPGTLTITGERTVTLTGGRLGGWNDPFATAPTGRVLIEAPTLTTEGTLFLIGGGPPASGDLMLSGTDIHLSNSFVSPGENFSPVNVQVRAADSARLTNVSMHLLTTSSPRGSSITIEGRNIGVQGSALSTSAGVYGGNGNGGSISMTATKNILVEESTLQAHGGGLPGIDGSIGSAGTIVLEAGKNVAIEQSALGTAGNRGAIHVKGGHDVQINESTLSTQGGGFFPVTNGNVILEAGKKVSLTDTTVRVGGLEKANGGNIALDAGSKIILDGSNLSAQSQGTGSDGHISLKSDKILLKKSSVAPSPEIVSD